jgi:anti-anti-sigma factor
MRARIYLLRRARYVVVMMHGDLDAASEPDVRTELMNIITAARASSKVAVIVDMCGVSSCDVAGVDLLQSCAYYAAACGVAFGLASLLPPIGDRFNLNDTDHPVPIYDGLYAAIHALTSETPDGPA